MSHPFDASSKYFMSLSLKDWLILIGEPANLDVSPLDSDLSTVSARADKVFLINGPKPRVEHIEVQSRCDRMVPRRVCRYGVLIHYDTGLTVNSTVILLHSAADGPGLTGIYKVVSENGDPFLEYRYKVIRLWELAPKVFLDAGIGVLPLAPLGKIEAEELPELLRQMQLRLESEIPRSGWNEYWTGTRVLMGLKYPDELIEELLKGIFQMFDIRESSTIQRFLNEGREEGTKQALVRVLTHRFGTVAPKLQEYIEAVSDAEVLQILIDRALDVQHPEELLPESYPGRKDAND